MWYKHTHTRTPAHTNTQMDIYTPKSRCDIMMECQVLLANFCLDVCAAEVEWMVMNTKQAANDT